jgi:hypothetical protein
MRGKGALADKKEYDVKENLKLVRLKNEKHGFAWQKIYPGIALLVGINAAYLLSYLEGKLLFSCDELDKEGYFWRTDEAVQSDMPFLSLTQIQLARKKLKEADLIDFKRKRIQTDKTTSFDFRIVHHYRLNLKWMLTVLNSYHDHGIKQEG